MDKAFFRMLLICLFITVAEIQGHKFSKWSKIRFFKNFLAHPVATPWPTWKAQCQNVRRSVTYICDCTWRRRGKQKR